MKLKTFYLGLYRKNIAVFYMCTRMFMPLKGWETHHLCYSYSVSINFVFFRL